MILFDSPDIDTITIAYEDGSIAFVLLPQQLYSSKKEEIEIRQVFFFF